MNVKNILDSEGKNPNFITNEPYSDQYKEYAKKWSLLPMYRENYVKQFFDLINTCQVLLLISGTGSGKTVLCPKLLLKYFIEKNITKKIAVTNPKVLTTVYNAEYAAKTLDVKLGESVGYKYKGSPKDVYSSDTRLLYCTDGIILATILAGDTYLDGYQGIIIDEAHERQINIDLLLRLLKIIIVKRADFKLIIMSATINSEVFSSYFDTKDIKYGEMTVSGESNYPIQENWLDAKTKVNRSNYVDTAIDIVLRILDTSKTGDIIVFVATTNDAIKGCSELKQKCPKAVKINCNTIYCVEVYSKMKESNKNMAVSKDMYKENTVFTRKVIFATNVAESSITFDGLVYVVDSGYELANYFNAEDNSYIITKQYTSQAQIKQRLGRAGRTCPGIAYHLYTQKEFNKLKPYPDPNILTTDITDTLLQLLKYSEDIKNLVPIITSLITIPNVDQFNNSISKLHYIDAIKVVPKLNTIKNYNNINMNGVVTKIGFNLLKFKSLPILSSYAIILSYYMECQEDIITIVSILEECNGNIDTLLSYNKKNENEVKDYYSKNSVKGSDFLTILSIYKKSDNKYISKKTMDNINNKIITYTKYASHINSYDYMKDKYKLGIRNPYSNNSDNILYVLGYAYNYNLLIKKGSEYTTINYNNNSKANLEWSIFTEPKETKNIVCLSLVNMFGKKLFKCLSCIPDNIIVDIMKDMKKLK
jgi:pre-mRNA-splicing factor ATP-dependent RNA helicase DHX15/PRP43